MSIDVNFMSELKAMIEDIKTIKATVAKTDQTINLFTSQISQLQQDNTQLKDKVEALTRQNEELSRKLNDLDQYSRVDNVLINGIPYTEEENVVNVVKNIAKHLQVNLEDHDINTAHRLRAQPGKIPAIIARLNNRNKKSELVKNSKRLRLHGSKLNLDPALPIYVSEQLSSYTLSLYKKAMELKNQKRIEHVWVNEGKIHIREQENSRSIRISTEGDLPNPDSDDINGDTQSNEDELSTNPKPSQDPNAVNLRSGPTMKLSQLSSSSNRGRKNSSKTTRTRR